MEMDPEYIYKEASRLDIVGNPKTRLVVSVTGWLLAGTLATIILIRKGLGDKPCQS
jgi:hypothetical protein